MQVHPLKSVLPGPLWRATRSWGTAILTPLHFSFRLGHFRSSLRERSVAADGSPLPWYTYPCIDFLAQRPVQDRAILEFGAGQSTLWWADRARSVLSFEGDEAWVSRIHASMPGNVDLRLVDSTNAATSLAGVEGALAAMGDPKFDLVIIDGLCRRDLIKTAFDHLSEDGAVILDNADSFGLWEATQGLTYQRADFFGFAPGVSKEACTAIFFKPGCFLFSSHHLLPRIGETRRTGTSAKPQ